MNYFSYQKPVLEGDQVEVDQLGGRPDLPVGEHDILIVARQPLFNLLKKSDYQPASQLFG
jgi:hypothetical protein